MTPALIHSKITIFAQNPRFIITVDLYTCVILKYLSFYSVDRISTLNNVALIVLKFEGDPKNRIFSKKRKFIYISNKKRLIPFKILSIGGNELVQPFFLLCEASLELLKLDVFECILRSCFHLLHGGKSLPFQCFFYCRE